MNASRRLASLVIPTALLGLALSACGSTGTGAAQETPQVSSNDTSAVEPPSVEVNKNAPVPSGVLGEDGPVSYGWPVNEFDNQRNTLTIYADFQCEGCGVFEGSPSAAYIASLAGGDEVNVVYRPTGFRDFALGNNATAATTGAWGCAIDEGFGEEYRNLAFYNQTVDGSGVSQNNLIAGGELVGMTPEQQETFADCVRSEKYIDWAYNSTALIGPDFAGTPSAKYNDKLIDREILWDVRALQAFTENGGELPDNFVSQIAPSSEVEVPIVE